MTQSEQHYNKMTRTPVGRLITTLSIPAIISMLITNIYNLADTYFVGSIGVSASGAVGIVFTLMSILQAIAFMLGQGSGSVISRLLAQKDVEKASHYASTGFFLAIIMGLHFTLIGIPLVKPLMRLLGSSETILPHAKAYAVYILAAAPMMIGSLVLNNMLRYEGKAFYGMIGLTTGGILNMIGDPILINVFHMGTAGAGLATAMSQTISFTLLLMFFIRHAQSKISIKYCLRSIAVLGDIITTGLPNLMRQGLTSISSGLLNHGAALYGDACVSAMAITNRCQFFMFSIALGIGQGFQPVAGFNYQAKKYDRVRKAYRFTLLGSLCMLLSFSVVGITFSRGLVSLFQKDPEVLRIGGLALKFASISLMFMPFNITSNMLFQSTGHKVPALLLAMFRGGMCFIPFILVLPHLIGLTGIQLSQPMADVLSAALSLPFSIAFFRKLPKTDMPDLA